MGKRKRLGGIAVFFLLLVLAFRVVTNLAPKVSHSKAVRATAEIANVQLALTKLLSDGGKSSFRDFFDPAGFEAACTSYIQQHGGDDFEASIALYTSATYGLLHHGREVLETPPPGGKSLPPEVVQVFRRELVKNLGTSYLSDLGDDPWGHRYQIYPGPWPEDLGPIIFRSYVAPASESPADVLTTAGPSGDSTRRGFPARTQLPFYIWSLGRNGVSDQPRYDPTHVYAPPARQYYRKDAPDEYLGGGDDINNWDKNQSFMRLYNPDAPSLARFVRSVPY